ARAGGDLRRTTGGELLPRGAVHAGRLWRLHPAAAARDWLLAGVGAGATWGRAARDAAGAHPDPAPVPAGPAVQLPADVRYRADPAGRRAPALRDAGAALRHAGEPGRRDEPGPDILS